MFKKENVLKKNHQFQKVLSKKKQFVNKYLILYYIPYKKVEIGISIPKKFANAAQRNYLKRQIRAILSKIDIQNLKYRIVIIIRKDFINLTFQEKFENIIKLMGKLQ